LRASRGVKDFCVMGLKQRSGRPSKVRGSVALAQARVLGRREEHLGAGWLDAIERGEAEASTASAGDRHGIAAPSATPYLDLALRAGGPDEWGFDLSGARPLRYAGFQRLIAAGVPMGFAAQLNGAGDLLAAQIDLSRDGERFAIGGPNGRLLLVVRDQFGVVVDVVALLLEHPREVASFVDGGDGVLGLWSLPHPGEAGRVAMFETPMDWLRAGGKGLCVYDWARAVGLLRQLGEAVTLEAPPALAAVVRAKLERGGLPLVASSVASDAKLSLAERIGRSPSGSAAIGQKGARV
jgi:hypothetical protein